jgi:CHAD domain-containing protein
MPYRIKRGESVPDAIQRIAMEQIERARNELGAQEPDAAEAVHQARKRFKKLRALARLVRPVMRNKTFKAENRFFRDQARALASARDDQVMLDTLEALTDTEPQAPFPEELLGLRDLLTERRDSHLNSGGEELGDRMAQVAAALGPYPERLAEWRVPSKGFKALAPGLERSYRDGRKALDRVRQEPDDELFHGLRKRVKDHWYHCRLLQGLWPELMETRSSELKRLSDMLGDDHDLSVFAVTLEAVPEDILSSQARARLARRVAKRQKRLRRDALVLAKRVYAERPKQLRERWHVYWEAWQHG